MTFQIWAQARHAIGCDPITAMRTATLGGGLLHDLSLSSEGAHRVEGEQTERRGGERGAEWRVAPHGSGCNGEWHLTALAVMESGTSRLWLIMLQSGGTSRLWL